MWRIDGKEEAKAKVKELNYKWYRKFCPLIKTDCDNRCVCFRKASMTAVARSNMPAPPIYEVHPKRCTNSMFSKGEET